MRAPHRSAAPQTCRHHCRTVITTPCVTPIAQRRWAERPVQCDETGAGRRAKSQHGGLSPSTTPLSHTRTRAPRPAQRTRSRSDKLCCCTAGSGARRSRRRGRCQGKDQIPQRGNGQGNEKSEQASEAEPEGDYLTLDCANMSRTGRVQRQSLNSAQRVGTMVLARHVNKYQGAAAPVICKRRCSSSLSDEKSAGV